MKEKTLIKLSKGISVVFSPFYAPLLAFMWLFFFSYLQLLPIGYKIFVLMAVLLFTIVIPRFGINIYRKINRWTHRELSARENRFIPYILTIISYAVCMYVFNSINTAQFMKGLLIAGLVAQLLCTVINLKWKVSTHMVGIGGFTGAYVAFGELFYFNPIWGLSLLILLSGLLGTARMYLRQHALSDIILGFLIGFLCAWFFVLIGW